MRHFEALPRDALAKALREPVWITQGQA